MDVDGEEDKDEEEDVAASEEGEDHDGENDGFEAGPTMFIPLLNGKEAAANVRLRERLFEKAWGWIERRIQVCKY